MGKLNKYSKIDFKGKSYAVSELKYGNHKVPIVIDWSVFTDIKDMEKNWSINDKGFVITHHKNIMDGKEVVKEVSLHDLILTMSGGTKDGNNKPILHVNKLGVDNRKSNLIYDTTNKNIKKNLKKKARTISLPKSLGIKVDEIPSYVWYLKENGSHGDRFVVEIGNISWKSTSSKKLSTRYKLEETKKYLRHLKKERGDLFEDYSMNGNLNAEGKVLMKEYLDIANKAGYTYLNDSILKDDTNDYLKENLKGLTKEEIMFLDMFVPNERLDFR